MEVIYLSFEVSVVELTLFRMFLYFLFSKISSFFISRRSLLREVIYSACIAMILRHCSALCLFSEEKNLHLTISSHRF